MTYQLSRNLFLENGAAVAAEAARARRARLDAFYAVQADRLAAARTVAGADFPIAA